MALFPISEFCSMTLKKLPTLSKQSKVTKIVVIPKNFLPNGNFISKEWARSNGLVGRYFFPLPKQPTKSTFRKVYWQCHEDEIDTYGFYDRSFVKWHGNCTYFLGST